MRCGSKSSWAQRVAWTLIAATIAWAVTGAAATSVRAPIVCSRGPSGQHFDALVTLPRSAAEKSTYTVRIDGVSSGTIEHTGLNYIHDMASDYALPTGTSYVAGSARIVPGTGSSNVAAGARVWQDGGKIHLSLPGRVESGSSYTPPSIEFQVSVTAKAGDVLPVSFLEYRVTANAVIVGDLSTTCDPTPTPFPMGSTVVTAAAP
jgi:hypothetical protein